MSAYVLFILLGLGAGSVYAILGLGMVLKYRAAGVVDFSQGAMAMFGAYVFVDLRDRGTLQLPWIVLPHEISVSSTGIGTWPAALVAIAYTGLLGLGLYMLVFRPIQTASALTKVCASVGVMLALTAVAVLNFGTSARSTAVILPSGSLQISGLLVPVDRLYFAGIVVVLAVGLALLYRYTRFGLATRAAAENSTGAALIGISARRIAAGNWVLGSVLAAIAGILISPVATLDPSSYTLFVVPALGCALLGRFQSFAVTAATGLGLGIVQALITKIVITMTWLPVQGISTGLPFIAILISLTVLTRRLAARGDVATTGNPSVGRPTRPLVAAGICLVLGTAALFALQGSLRVALISSLVTAVICLSLVVLTGYIGQVSLAQLAFAGVSAFTLTHVTAGAGLPFPLALLVSSLVAVPLGVLIGLPALRLRGVNLAIVTLAAAAAFSALVFGIVAFTGGLAGRKVGPAMIGGLDVSIARGQEYPRVIFGVFVLVVLCTVAVLVARLRVSAAGRMFLAVRSNERAAAAAGIDVPRAKLMAFAFSSFIAGLGGGLLAYQQGTVSSATFDTFASLSLLAIVYVAGVGRITGAVLAGVLLAPSGLVVSFLDKTIHIGAYQTIVAGLLLTLTAIQNPDGIATSLARSGLGVRLSKLWHRLFDGPAIPDPAPVLITPTAPVKAAS